MYKEINRLPAPSHKDLLEATLNQLSELKDGVIDSVMVATDNGLVEVTSENYFTIREDVRARYWMAYRAELKAESES